MSDESSDLRALLAAAPERPRRRRLPMWAHSGLLGLISGGVLLALVEATGPLGSSGGADGATRTQFILLLTALCCSRRCRCW